MSEPRTLRELWDSFIDGQRTTTQIRTDFLAEYGDALVGLPCNAVVALEELEKGAKAMHEAWLGCMLDFYPDRTEGLVPWSEVPEKMKEVNRRGIRAALTAMHITVADEVAVVWWSEGGRTRVNPPGSRCNWDLELRPGDTLYIVRAKEE